MRAADDAFVTGIRVAMLVGFFVAVSALIVGWRLLPRRRRAHQGGRAGTRLTSPLRRLR